MTTSTPATYRFAPALVVRLAGTLLVLLGLGVVVLAVLVRWLGLPGALLSLVVLLAAAAVVLTGGLVWALARSVPVVRFDEAGYQVRLLRRPGVRQARWRDVEDAVTAEVAGHPCVVVRLRDGRTTTLPVTVLDAPADAVVADLRSHLDAGHGYRRLR